MTSNSEFKVKPLLAAARDSESGFVHRCCPSVCLLVCRQNAKNAIFSKTKQFRAMVSIDDLQEVVHQLFKEPIIGYPKSKMAEIRHLENRHDVIFSAENGPIWIKFRRLVRNDMSTAMMWSKSKPDVEFQYGGRLGNSMACHPRPTCHIARCKNSISHIENLAEQIHLVGS